MTTISYWCSKVKFIVEYDRLVNALYIKLRNDKIVNSDEAASGIIVDYNKQGDIVGIEILDFSKRRLNLSKLVLKGPKAFLAEARRYDNPSMYWNKRKQRR